MEDNQSKHNRQIKDTLEKIKDYMNSNKLVLNKEKSKLLVLTKNNEIRKNIQLKIEGIDEPIRPVKSILYLGIQIQDDLKWNQFLTDGPENLAKKLKQKLNAIKSIRKYMGDNTTKMILNRMFMANLLYGACLWLGAQKYLKDRIQVLQLEACRLAIGRKATRWSATKLLK